MTSVIKLLRPEAFHCSPRSNHCPFPRPKQPVWYVVWSSRVTKGYLLDTGYSPCRLPFSNAIAEEVSNHAHRSMGGCGISNLGNLVHCSCAGGRWKGGRGPICFMVIFDRWVDFTAHRSVRTPTEVTKHTYEVKDDFENSNYGNRVR